MPPNDFPYSWARTASVQRFAVERIMYDDLEPMAPERAVELYLEDKRSEYAELTLASHESRLRKFLSWCNEEDIENLNDLSGRKLKAYKIWRRNDGDLAPASLKGQLATLRVFR